MKNPIRILGIDPGTNIMGYGIIESDAREVRYVDHGILKFPRSEDAVQRLGIILKETYALLDKFKPQISAVEAPFFGKNVQSMLKLGRAQGVIMAASLSREVEVFEYAPRRIKQSITGKGNSSKEQVSEMLFRMLHIPSSETLTLDATDALAAAFCHHLQFSPLAQVPNPPSQTGGQKKTRSKGTKGYSGWDAFLNKHPDREV